MSLETLIPEARNILTSSSDVTALVAADKITFARRPQGDTKPGISINMGPVEYIGTTLNATSVVTYRVDYEIFGSTAASTTAIHDKVKAAVTAASSSNFLIRLFDEDYFVDVDDVHRARVMVNFELSDAGAAPSTVNYVTNSLNGRVTAKIRSISSASIASTDFLGDDYILYLTGTAPSVVIPSASSNQSRILGLYYAGTSGVATVTVDGGGTIDGGSSYSLTTSSRFVEFMSVSESSTHSWKSQLSGGGGSDIIVRETSGNSSTATTLQFPDDSVTHDGSGKATISMLQGVVTEYGSDGGLTSSMFPNGLFGDIDQDGVVDAGDLLAVLGHFGNTASPTSDQVAASFSRAQSQISNGDSSFFQTSRSSAAQATVTAFTNAGHVVEYFEGINSAQGRGFVSNFLADTVSGSTVRRTMYISGTPFPTGLSQMQQYPLGPYDNQAKSLIQTVVNAYINSVTANGSVIILRTLISSTPDKLLDTYTGAAAAYSVRLLDKDYSGNCMRIRRDSDDSETDIGFDSSGDLDTSAIATHCGSANGYVVTWYDQSGNTNNATQSTDGSQPQIYDGSAVITDNGKPALDFDGSNDGLRYSGNLGISGSTDRSFFIVCTINNGGVRVFDLSDGTVLSGIKHYALAFDSSSVKSYRFNGGYQVFNAPHTASQQDLFSGLHDGPNVNTGQLYIKGIQQTQSSTTSSTMATVDTQLDIGGLNPNNQNINGSIQELILYPVSNSSNRSAIETNIDNYFNIPGM